MTTEKQIQVNLNKFKSKKQNLGVIEDAIKEQQDKLKNYTDEMVAITRQLETALSDYATETAQATSDLSDAMRTTDDEISILLGEAQGITFELENLGITPSVDVFQIAENFTQLYDLADSKI